MEIQIDHITDQTVELNDSRPADHFPVLIAWSKSGDGRIIAPLNASLRVRRTGKLIEVSGVLKTAVELTCSRCLASFEQPLDHTFRIHFSPGPTPDSETDPSKDIQLDGEDIGHYQYQDEQIDLRQAMAEEALATLPLQPLCRDDCQGLCSQCGAALNQGDCHCDRQTIDLRWAALAQLKK